MSKEIIIYLIFAIIYFVVRTIRKRKLPPGGDERQPESGKAGTPQPAAPMTIEDILREVIQDKKTVPQPQPQSQPQQSADRSFRFPSDGSNYEEVQDEWADKNVATVKEGSSTRLFSNEESKRIYQQSVHIESEGTDALAMQLKRTQARFAESEMGENSSAEFRKELVKMLTDKGGARKAVVLSEILNRKY